MILQSLQKKEEQSYDSIPWLNSLFLKNHIRCNTMTDIKKLDKLRKCNLEESIILYLAKIKHIDERKAMDIYYKSSLATAIEKSMYGMENLDYKYLVNDLIENEPELFEKKN